MKILYSSCIKNPKHASFEGEDKDEEIVLTLRQHHITNLNWILFFVFMLFLPRIFSWGIQYTEASQAPSLPLNYRIVLGMFWYLICFTFAFVSFLIWFFSVYIVSTKRVIDIDFHGLFHRRFSEALLSNIEDLTHTIIGIGQVFFRYGTLSMQTAGEQRELEFDNIPDPGTIQDIVSDLAEKSGRRGRRHDDD